MFSIAFDSGFYDFNQVSLSVEQQLAAALAECERLRTENRQLRELKPLGIKSRMMQKIHLDPTTLLSRKPVAFENVKDDSRRKFLP